MPIHPVLYWRDEATKADDGGTLLSLDDLIANPATEPQTLQFDTDAKQLEVIVESGDDPVTNEPGLNPDGTIAVYKQQGRSGVPTLTLQGNVDVDQIAWRNRLRSFAYKRQVENNFHSSGILGFFHPRLTDFNRDPDDTIGYTMALPFFQHQSAAGIVTFRINLSLGTKSLS